MSSAVANARVFRHLMKTSRSVAIGCDLGNPEGFHSYISGRFRTVAEANRRARVRPHELKRHRAMVVHYAKAMSEAPGDDQLTAILGALAAGVGSSVYKRSLEKGFFDLVVFNKRSAERGEADEEQTAERQNRIMQAAIAPIADRLAHLHRGLSVPELRNAMSSAKVGTSVVVLSHGSSEVVIEVDEELNKQTIYVRVEDDEFMRVMLAQGRMRERQAQREAAASAGSEEGGVAGEAFGSLEDAMMLDGDFTATSASSSSSSSGPSTANLDGRDPLEDESELHKHHFSLFNDRVEVAESDLVRGTTLHAHWGGVAMRLLDAMLEEMPLHRSRSTVLAGHGVGGAVALVLGLQLHTMGFEVKNVVQLGSPRVVQDTLNRYVTAISPLRVVINGDPCTQGPATTSEGESFVHVGEVLMVDEPAVGEEDGDASPSSTRGRRGSVLFNDGADDDTEEGSSEDVTATDGKKSADEVAFARRFDAHRYAALLKREDVRLIYAEGDDSFLEPEWKHTNRSGGLQRGSTEAKTRHGGSAPTFDR